MVGFRAVCAGLGTVACTASASPVQEADFRRLTVAVDGAPADLIAVDVDRDGFVDLVVASGDVQVLLGDGTRLRPAQRVDAGPSPTGLASADFDGDGWPDLAVANHETDHVTVLLGGSDGFRPSPDSPIRLDLAPHPHDLAAGDVTGDGLVDLLVDDREGRRVLLLPGDGRGRFGAPRGIPVGGDPYREMWLGDLDGDGDLDLVTPNERHLAILLGDGGGGFEDAPGSPVPVPAPFALAVADLNGDGTADLISLGDERREGVTVMLGDHAGRYRPAEGSPLPGVVGPGRLAAGDVNGDGYDDVVAGPWSGDSLLLVLGGKDGVTTRRLEVGRNPWSVIVADLNGDGRADVASANEGGGDVTVLLSREP